MNEHIKTVLKENMYEMLTAYVSQKRPFKILLWQNDDWDKDLPTNITQEFPEILPIDIGEIAFENCYIEDDIVYLVVMFGNELYSKVVIPDDIYAIIDLENGSQQINDIIPETNTRAIKSLEDVIKTLVEVLDVPKINARKSVKVFEDSQRIFDE